MRVFLQRLYAMLNTRRFFWAVLAFFVLQAAWIALSAVYPMAFDEDFHFGIIKIYSHYWLPFLSHQPAGSNVYGAVVHDPSYLYQYLMSFPYRIIELFTKDQTIQIICLRLINVALFTYALVLFRRLLLRAKVSPAFTNVSILLFTLIPIVPLLAATINYDNLTMVGVAWAGLLMADIIPEIQNKHIPLTRLVLLATVCLLGGIVKYPFLPIAAACVIVLVALWLHVFQGSLWGKTWHAIKVDYRKLGVVPKVVLPIIFLVSLGLFSQRYLLNLAVYKEPVPKCEKVLTVNECMAYGPWARSYEDAQFKSTGFHAHLTSYIPLWLQGMWYRLFFAVNGNVASPDWARYETIPPLPLPSITAIVLAVVSVTLIVRWWRKIFYGDWLMILFLLMVIMYGGALFVTNYASYKHTGQPVAINGRYLLPLLLPFAAIAGRAWQATLRRRQLTKTVLACAAILLFLQGGGVLTFMINSNYTWYWPNHAVQSANQTAHNIAQKAVLDSQTLWWSAP